MEWMAAALHGIEIPRADLLGFCAQNHIRKLALFGPFSRTGSGPTAMWTCWWCSSLTRLPPTSTLVGMEHHVSEYVTHL